MQYYKTGVVNLPLHSGRAPAWLMNRMTLLVGEIIYLLAVEFGVKTVLARLADPLWFQSLGCVLGFDWHSSGLTTTTGAALKRAIKLLEKELKLFTAGGKGKYAFFTPLEIQEKASILNGSYTYKDLIYASRITAKVDNSAVQDGYSLYHHMIFFDSTGNWVVIQQGMNTSKCFARRYHWLGEEVESFVCEPHKGIITPTIEQNVLNLVSLKSSEARTAITLLSKEKPDKIIKDLNKIKEWSLPKTHPLDLTQLNSKKIHSILLKTYERSPQDFEQLLDIKGVGASTLRALTLVAELIYGVKADYKDPARFSYAHGGKDGYPYPVNRKTYDKTIEIMEKAIKKVKMGNYDKLEALKRLYLLSLKRHEVGAQHLK